ncbi:unnamed protein product [Schistosoma curassoni]|uniref:CCDC66 domain-containing protein n=1 Tax=Schistosoma curassoni TaxID=6186 RepID=A0A183L667_9TREM|nr:unnamed protein product [Schistosoma curassoni]
MREARRQSQWSSRAAEEKAIREREEADRRRQEEELALEAERRKEQELRRIEEEKRLLVEARKRDDIAKRKVSMWLFGRHYLGHVLIAVRILSSHSLPCTQY